ncbi:hypothetical protein ABPG74_012170 [Tetrahymena malaccensis]
MEYRILGETGLKVSAISFGNYLNSDKPDWQERTNQLVKKAHELGINFFDTAEVYGWGEGEKQLGIALKQLNIPREDLVISTKLFWAVPDLKVNRTGLSRKHIIEGLNNSLVKLQLDYVDLVFCHRFDDETPLEEVCRTFDSIIKSGKAHYWGTSEWSAANIFEAYMVCERFNLIKPVMEQPQYNILVRERFEKEYGRLFDKYRMGSTVWSPLAGGLLTGKYNNGIPDSECRAKTFSDDPMIQEYIQEYLGEANKAKFISIFQRFGEIAKKIGCTQAQLAMAWVLKNKDVSSAITSASSISQLEDTVKSLNFVSLITDEIEKEVNEIFGTQPKPEPCMRTWGMKPPRR